MHWTHRGPLIAAFALAGCVAEHVQTETRADASTDAAASADAGVPGPVAQRYMMPQRAAVDVLIVVDDSGSMCEEQADLAAALPGLVAAWREVDLRFAVISTDMQDPAKMGRFLAEPTPPVQPINCPLDAPPATADCPADLQPVLSGDDLATACGGDADCVTAEMGRRLACMVQLGTTGDGFEQGLGAMRQATRCDGPNAAHFAACCVDGAYDPACTAKVSFLRPEAQLVVVFVSDEDDCSDDPDAPISRSANTNCEWSRDRLVPVERYAQHLTHLKANPADMIVVAAVVGGAGLDPERTPHYRAPTPEDEGCLDAQQSYDPALDPEGACCVDGVCPGRIQPVCTGDLGDAFAGHRYLALADLFPVAIRAPLCEQGWIDPLEDMIGRGVWAWCLDQPPACRREANLAEGDAGRPCTAAEAADGLGASVEMVVNGRALTPGEDYTVRANEGCPGGYRVMPTANPGPEATIAIWYLPEP